MSYKSLLAEIEARGYSRQAVEQCLAAGVLSSRPRPDSRGNTHYDVTVQRPDLGRPCVVQLRQGPDGGSCGCVTCTREQANGRYRPYLVKACPAVGAAMVEYAYGQRTEPVSPESNPAEVHPADALAAELVARYPGLAERIERAVELVKAGLLDYPEYATGIQFETNTYLCECPDARFRAPRAEEVGMGCKHCFAQYIARRLEEDSWSVACRKLVDRVEHRRNEGAPVTGWQYSPETRSIAQQRAEARAELGVALKPDRINQKGRFGRDFNIRRR